MDAILAMMNINCIQDSKLKRETGKINYSHYTEMQQNPSKKMISLKRNDSITH